jgi:hypothetical protein
MIGTFPTMCVEKYSGGMGTNAKSATGRMMNGTRPIPDIWSCITPNIMLRAAKTSNGI